MSRQMVHSGKLTLNRWWDRRTGFAARGSDVLRSPMPTINKRDEVCVACGIALGEIGKMPRKRELRVALCVLLWVLENGGHRHSFELTALAWLGRSGLLGVYRFGSGAGDPGYQNSEFHHRNLRITRPFPSSFFPDGSHP